jgi:hypothetical protein
MKYLYLPYHNSSYKNKIYLYSDYFGQFLSTNVNKNLPKICEKLVRKIMVRSFSLKNYKYSILYALKLLKMCKILIFL